MYLFHFGNYYGNDRVVLYPQKINAKPWDCILLQGQYFLVLWKTVAWWCEYKLEWTVDYHLAEKQLISQAAMKMVHLLVKEYFSSYKNIIPLWLGSDIDQLLKRKNVLKKKNKKSSTTLLTWDTENNCLIEKNSTTWEQSIIVFPNLWALYFYGRKWIGKNRVWLDSWKRTEKQRSSCYWKIKSWEATTLLCTSSGIFKDWKKLSHMHVHQPHQWRYKNRQDPRYDVNDVIWFYASQK